jgi:hypothetical protein
MKQVYRENSKIAVYFLSKHFFSHYNLNRADCKNRTDR